MSAGTVIALVLCLVAYILLMRVRHPIWNPIIWFVMSVLMAVVAGIHMAAGRPVRLSFPRIDIPAWLVLIAALIGAVGNAVNLVRNLNKRRASEGGEEPATEVPSAALPDAADPGNALPPPEKTDDSPEGPGGTAPPGEPRT